MYLSKVTLKPNHRMTYCLLADFYAQHRFVMSAFPDRKGFEKESDGSQSAQGVLYRLDTRKQSKEMFFLVQSIAEPDWDKVQSLHGETMHSYGSRDWNPSFLSGESYRFRLRASPTICRVNRDAAGNRNPRRDGLFKEEEQRDWLVRAAERSGFEVTAKNVIITPQGKLTATKPSGEDRKSGNQVTCFTVDFEGVLLVTDAERFAAALGEGIGRGKAWGCGLLSVVRA